MHDSPVAMLDQGTKIQSLEQRTQDLVRDLLHVLIPGEVLEEHPHLGDTPRRVADWLLQYSQHDTTLEQVMKVFPEKYDGMILEKDIPFSALCAHHLLPFSGKAAIAYVPNEKIAGLSKLTRVVQFYAERVTLQESITQNIVEGMNTLLEPHFVCAYLYDVTHGCMTARGVKALHTTADTYAFKQVQPEAEQVQEWGALLQIEDYEGRFWNMIKR